MKSIFLGQTNKSKRSWYGRDRLYAVGRSKKLFSQELNYLISESLIMGVKNMFETIFLAFMQK